MRSFLVGYCYMTVRTDCHETRNQVHPQRSAVSPIAVEQCPAVFGEHHFSSVARSVAVDLDVTVGDRVFPDHVTGAVALPFQHSFVIGAALAGDPGKKF